ncbi:MAG: hypothetical protein ACRDHE_10595 [Ktedonobacterales bacterium]
MHAAHPAAAVEVWAMDEHHIGLKPILRRVGAPRGQRPLVAVHPRSGHTQWHLAATVSVALFATSLAHVAEQVGAGPAKEVVLVLDRAGWHVSRHLVVPAHPHLLPLPLYSPSCSRPNGSRPSPPHRSSMRFPPMWTRWTTGNSTAASPCKPTRT